MQNNLVVRVRIPMLVVLIVPFRKIGLLTYSIVIIAIKVLELDFVWNMLLIKIIVMKLKKNKDGYNV